MSHVVLRIRSTCAVSEYHKFDLTQNDNDSFLVITRKYYIPCVKRDARNTFIDSAFCDTGLHTAKVVVQLAACGRVIRKLIVALLSKKVSTFCVTRKLMLL